MYIPATELVSKFGVHPLQSEQKGGRIGDGKGRTGGRGKVLDSERSGFDYSYHYSV